MTRHTLIILLVSGLLLLLSVCNEDMSPEGSLEAQAWTMIDKGAVLVDVRSKDEYNQGHLHNSLHIPYDQLASRISELGADKNAQVVLYCRSGKRAGKAEATLRENGFSNILNAGGYAPMMKHKQP